MGPVLKSFGQLVFQNLLLDRSTSCPSCRPIGLKGVKRNFRYCPIYFFRDFLAQFLCIKRRDPTNKHLPISFYIVASNSSLNCGHPYPTVGERGCRRYVLRRWKVNRISCFTFISPAYFGWNRFRTVTAQSFYLAECTVICFLCHDMQPPHLDRPKTSKVACNI